jgi:hypothetical protein
VILVTCDPGKKTGWAALDTSNMASYTSGEMPFMDFLTWTWGWLPQMHDAHIACERFVITGGTVRKSRGDLNWSIESVGVLRFMGAVLNVGFELQNAADAMKFCDDQRLRDVGWWFKGGDGHANDAGRHMLLLIARRWPQLLPAGVIPP